MIFWATLAVVSAIWATTGTVDYGTLLMTALTIVCLVQVRHHEKARR